MGTKIKRKPKKRPYKKKTLDTLKVGDWKFPFKPDEKVAPLLIKEAEEKGSDYQFLINQRLLESYTNRP